jgi:metal-responsive CopG/Arc/MetJ family transcriptional regulator
VTGRGRPSTGVKVQVRIPADLLAVLDDIASSSGMSRAEAVRDILARNLRWLAPQPGGPPVD